MSTPKALTPLKNFRENAPGLAVATAGLLLDLIVREGAGYPASKVDTLNLYPLSFREFPKTIGNGNLVELIDTGNTNPISSFSSKSVPLLRQYYDVGGMPEAVLAFLEKYLLEDVRHPGRNLARL